MYGHKLCFGFHVLFSRLAGKDLSMKDALVGQQNGDIRFVCEGSLGFEVSLSWWAAYGMTPT